MRLGFDSSYFLQFKEYIMDTYRAMQQSKVGVGGLKCYCCNDYEGKDKPILNRIARRKLKQQDKKENNAGVVEW